MENTELHVARALKHIEEARADLRRVVLGATTIRCIGVADAILGRVLECKEMLAALIEAMKVDNNKQGG